MRIILPVLWIRIIWLYSKLFVENQLSRHMDIDNKEQPFEEDRRPVLTKKSDGGIKWILHKMYS
jgi:hypothetical protein